MKDNIFVYFLFDQVAGVRWNTFLNSSDEAALRLIKNDIFKMVKEPDKNSILLSRVSDSILYKYVDVGGGNAKIEQVKELKDLVPFDLDLTLKVKNEQANN